MILVNTLVYHITHISNLPSIVQGGGLKSVNRLRRESTGYRDIAYESIQERRARTMVPCAAGGVLHDYVPFYFGPRSPMLFTLSQGNVQQYQGKQWEIITLVSTAEAIAASARAFVFTDGHPVLAFSEFYDDLAQVPKVIDFQLMKSKYWFDTKEEPDRMRRRQAEFLVHDMMPWELIIGAGVQTTEAQAAVAKILPEMAAADRVRLRPQWYYD